MGVLAGVADCGRSWKWVYGGGSRLGFKRKAGHHGERRNNAGLQRGQCETMRDGKRLKDSCWWAWPEHHPSPCLSPQGVFYANLTRSKLLSLSKEALSNLYPPVGWAGRRHPLWGKWKKGNSQVLLTQKAAVPDFIKAKLVNRKIMNKFT